MPGKYATLILGLFGYFYSASHSYAQTERVTAEEINIQKVFIEASKNKILGAYDEAERLFLEVLDKDKQNHTAAYELGRVYVSKNDYAKALEYANLAIRIAPGVAWYQMLKADILEARQAYPEAAVVYETLSRANPKESYYYEHLADIYEKTNQPGKALETLERYEDQFGIIEPVIRRKFDMFNEMGKPEEALHEVDKLIRIYPDELDYRHLAAAYARQVGFNEQANRYYADILKIDPNDGKANLAMASAYKTEGDDLAYLKSISAIIRNPSIPVDAKVQELIPYVDKLMEKRDPALEENLFTLLSDLQKNHPHEAKVFAILGDYCHATDQLEQARVNYERTILLDDSVFPVWDQLINIQAKMHDWPALIKTTETAMDVFPNQGAIYFFNGIGYQMTGDYLEAESAYAQALIMSGRDKVMAYRVLVQLGEVNHALGRYSKSDDAFRKALAINGNAFPALNQYAYALAQRKERLPEAGDMIDRALKADPGSARGNITRAMVLLQTGNAAEGKALLEQIEPEAGEDERPLLYEHLGDAYLMLGDRETAIVQWKKALAAGGHEESLMKKLNENKVN